MPTTPLEVQLLHPDAVAPARTREGDAGHDLRAVAAEVIPPGEHRVVPTGIAIALPDGIAGLVTPRSGLAAQHGITLVNTPGLIDPNYRGEIKVILRNEGREPFAVEPGDRIAQLLLVPFSAPPIRIVSALTSTERGSAGFGSSGRR
ncbi:MAG TPA: dUTP diphosphatase [Solirubrobacteraceae bacterium]|nr:dUTP diphosphatase [Solirubrobacteraceae bacterium]